MVLINKESDFLATEEEGNTVVEAADGSGAVLTEMTIEIAGEVRKTRSWCLERILCKVDAHILIVFPINLLPQHTFVCLLIFETYYKLS